VAAAVVSLVYQLVLRSAGVDAQISAVAAVVAESEIADAAQRELLAKNSILKRLHSNGFIEQFLLKRLYCNRCKNFPGLVDCALSAKYNL
jgi:hypothetical protein